MKLADDVRNFFSSPWGLTQSPWLPQVQLKKTLSRDPSPLRRLIPIHTHLEHCSPRPDEVLGLGPHDIHQVDAGFPDLEAT